MNRGITKRISINDKTEYVRIYEVINHLMNKCYQGWQKATYQIDDDREFWFPKLAVCESGEYVSQGSAVPWVNLLSSDGETIHTHNDGEISPRKTWDKAHVTFAKEKGHGYKYIGTFMLDWSSSGPHDLIYRRIRTEEYL